MALGILVRMQQGPRRVNEQSRPYEISGKVDRLLLEQEVLNVSLREAEARETKHSIWAGNIRVRTNLVSTTFAIDALC